MSSGDGGAGARQEQEEKKREGLRNRLNQFYGIDPVGGIDRREFYTIPTEFEVDSEKGPVKNTSMEFDQAAYDRALAGLRGSAQSSRESMAAEESQLEDATRGYYTDQLNREAEKQERRRKFALADRGLLRGSVDIDTSTELRRARDEGGVKIEDEVHGALNQLRTQREAERQNALQLIQSGVGEDAVASASAGLQRALSNAQARERTDIASGVFSTLADTIQPYDPYIAAAQRYQQRLRSFYPSTTDGGRVTRG